MMMNMESGNAANAGKNGGEVKGGVEPTKGFALQNGASVKEKASANCDPSQLTQVVGMSDIAKHPGMMAPPARTVKPQTYGSGTYKE